MIQLRPYQKECVDALHGFMERRPNRNPLVCMPTGAGKSLVQAASVSAFFEEGQRILCLAHIKELLVQNRNDALQMYNPRAYNASGFYSSGLKQRDLKSQIIFGGIQSIYTHPHSIGHVDKIYVDEAHRVPNQSGGRYRDFFGVLENYNRGMVIIGQSATCYRSGSGMLTSGQNRIFHSIVYNVDIVRLIKEGYLSKLVTKAGRVHYDTSGVQIVKGQYNNKQLTKRVNQQLEITTKAVAECLTYTERKKGLYFCTSIEQAKYVTSMLKANGKRVALVTGGTAQTERDKAVEDLVKGRLDTLVNVGVYTTGFNCKDVDMIVLLRPMQSTGLYVQMVGRGLRIHPDKADCLILDFGKNIERHGPINKIRPKANVVSSTKGGKIPFKSCPESYPDPKKGCGADVPINVMICPDCGYEFEAGESLTGKAATNQIIDMDPEQKWTPVEKLRLRVHQKTGKPDSVCVEYLYDGFPCATEYVCPEHPGRAGSSAKAWLKKRIPEDNYRPTSAAEMVERADELKVPKAVETQMRNGYRTIVDYKWE